MRSFNLQGYCDIREVASLARYLIRHNLMDERSLSFIVRTAIGAAYQHVINQGDEPFETAEEAVQFMEVAGFSMSQMNAADKRSQAITKHLQLDSLRAESMPDKMTKDTLRLMDKIDRMPRSQLEDMIGKLFEEGREADDTEREAPRSDSSDDTDYTAE